MTTGRNGLQTLRHLTQLGLSNFSQACAYRLFSHRSYLVVPKQAHADELARLDALCEIFGIGLVTFVRK